MQQQARPQIRQGTTNYCLSRELLQPELEDAPGGTGCGVASKVVMSHFECSLWKPVLRFASKGKPIVLKLNIIFFLMQVLS